MENKIYNRVLNDTVKLNCIYLRMFVYFDILVTAQCYKQDVAAVNKSCDSWFGEN